MMSSRSPAVAERVLLQTRNLADTATQVGVSVATLYRWWQKRHRCTPLEWLRGSTEPRDVLISFRVTASEAAELQGLAQFGESINDVARDLLVRAALRRPPPK